MTKNAMNKNTMGDLEIPWKPGHVPRSSSRMSWEVVSSVKRRRKAQLGDLETLW